MRSIVFQREGRESCFDWESTAATEYLATKYLEGSSSSGASQPMTTPSQTTDNNMAPEPDYPVLLNNFFQEHPTGNLTPFFHYAMTKDGPDDNVIYTARAIFRGGCYGEGRGRRIGLAKSEAARRALEYFQANPVPEA